MYRNFITSLLVVIFSISYSYADISFRNYSIDKAKGVAKLEKRNILVTYSAEWCLPCKLLHEGAFKDMKLSQLLNNEFVNIEAHHENIEDREWFQNYNVNDLPIMLVVNDKGEELTRISGLLTTEILLQTFNQYIKGGSPENPIDYQTMYKDKYKIRTMSEMQAAKSQSKVSEKPVSQNERKVLIAFRKFDKYKKAKKELKKLNSKHQIDAILMEEIIGDKTYYTLVGVEEYSFADAAALFSSYQNNGVDCTIKTINQE